MKAARLLLLIGACVPAMTQAALAPEPSAIQKDNLQITPMLKVGIASDDNYYSEPKGGEDDTLVYTVAPSVVIHRGDEEEYGKVELKAKAGVVSEESDDNYLDVGLMLAGRDMVAKKTGLEGIFGYRHGHDARGTGNTRGCRVGGGLPACDAEPDEYDETYLRLALQHGLTDSRGRLNGALQLTRHEYSNNEARTDFLNYNRASAEFKFSWKVGGRTDAVAEVQIDDYDYFEGKGADSFGVTYLAGVEWDITGKTSGYLKGGLQTKDFSSSTREDLEEPSWRVGVNWNPNDYSALNLEYSQSVRESDAAGADAITVDGYSARYSILFAERVEPWVSYSFSNSAYEGIVREDETKTLSAGVDYKFRRWVVLGLAWKAVEETSDAPGLDYERNVIALTANMTL